MSGAAGIESDEIGSPLSRPDEAQAEPDNPLSSSPSPSGAERDFLLGVVAPGGLRRVASTADAAAALPSSASEFLHPRLEPLPGYRRGRSRLRATLEASCTRRGDGVESLGGHLIGGSRIVSSRRLLLPADGDAHGPLARARRADPLDAARAHWRGPPRAPSPHVARRIPRPSRRADTLVRHSWISPPHSTGRGRRRRARRRCTASSRQDSDRSRARAGTHPRLEVCAGLLRPLRRPLTPLARAES